MLAKMVVDGKHEGTPTEYGACCRGNYLRGASFGWTINGPDMHGNYRAYL